MTIEQRFWKKVKKTATCWLWTAYIRHNGYGEMRVGGFKDGRAVKAHRLSWEIANQRTIPEGACVLHRCDTPACVRPDHLFLGTQQDNLRDMNAKGRHRSKRPGRYLPYGDDHPMRKHPELVKRGEHHGMAKLTEETVREMRRIKNTQRISFEKLGAMFNTDRTNASLICRGKTWTHVTQ